MKRMLLVLAIILIVVGLVRGWFALSGPSRQPQTNKVDVNFTVDPEKMKQDAGRVEEKAEELKDKALERIHKN
jgi:hypothetical protein